MYIKIYFKDKPLFLCDEMNEEINGYAHHDDAVFVDEFSTPAVNSIIHEMRQEKVHSGIILHKDFDQLKRAVWRKFTTVKAGGGVVKNDSTDKMEILMIYRRGKWDLPKGKLDAGETIEECAIREVKEETGIKKVILGNYLTTTFHVYNEGGHQILKESYWYWMKSFDEEKLVPQTEEQISDILWVASADFEKYKANTYPSIIDVLNQVSKVG